MTLKDLTTNYQPQPGDLRSHATTLGVFDIAIFTGKDWISLHGMESQALMQLTSDLANLGRDRSQKNERPVSYWRAKGQTAEEQTAWWASKPTPANKRWTTPAYGLGEIVWRRSDPMGAAATIEGIHLVEGWTDEEDPECSQPQTWEYRLSGSRDPVGQDALVNRSGLALAVGAAAALQAHEDPFDPFLDD